MAKTQTRPYLAAAYLQSDGDVAAYLQAALDDGDPAIVIHAIGNIARARGFAAVADEAGLEAEALSKALSPEGKPEFAMVLKVVRALRIGLRAEPVSLCFGADVP
jgi:probable addiction module antidote protein